MSKLSVAFALVLLTVPAVGTAKDKVDPRMAAMLACGSVAANEARLRCYDEAATTVKAAIKQGDLVVNERPRPQALAGVVRTSGAFGDNRFWVELDNGDRWQVTSEQTFDDAPRAGIKVTLRKGALGSYWFQTPGEKDRRATFLGRRS